MTSHQTSLSVLMTAYNADRYIGAAIESILNQSYTDFALLIIDDCSTDQTLEIINSFDDKRILVFKNQQNQGYLKSINTLLEKCKGDYIAFQDADDWSHQDKFQIQINAFKEDRNLEFCGTQCLYHENTNTPRKSKFPSLHSSVISQLEQGETVLLCGASVMIKRTLFMLYGGYRDFFDRIGAEDLDWFWRMLNKHKFSNLSGHLYNYRSVQSSLTKQIDLNPLKYHSTQIALLAYWQRKNKNYDELDNDRHSKQLINKILEPYVRNPSLVYRQAATTQLAFGQKENYYRCLRESIAANGLSYENLKLALIWIPIFFYKTALPNRIKRMLIKRRNLMFLARMGVKHSELKNRAIPSINEFQQDDHEK